jgi:hypothetical protein
MDESEKMKRRPLPESDQYSEGETARRRDEVVRRMANTPPQPRVKTPIRQAKKKKPTGSALATRKKAAGEKES